VSKAVCNGSACGRVYHTLCMSLVIVCSVLAWHGHGVHVGRFHLGGNTIMSGQGLRARDRKQPDQALLHDDCTRGSWRPARDPATRSTVTVGGAPASDAGGGGDNCVRKHLAASRVTDWWTRVSSTWSPSDTTSQMHSGRGDIIGFDLAQCGCCGGARAHGVCSPGVARAVLRVPRALRADQWSGRAPMALGFIEG
jgi:hypothetical protein